MNYGGFFVGTGINRSYLGGVTDWYDFCESDKWNIKALSSLLEDIGIDLSCDLRVLWCLPGKSLKNFGLADVLNDDDCNNMAAAVAVGNKSLFIYVDHDDSMRGYCNDDVVQFPAVSLPPIISPTKVSCEQADRKHRQKRKINFDNEFEFDSDGSDSDYEQEIVDSDYDLAAGDDDLYEDCIEESEDVKGKKVADEVQLDESEDELQLPDSDDEEVKFKFKNFASADMCNPNFKVG